MNRKYILLADGQELIQAGFKYLLLERYSFELIAVNNRFDLIQNLQHLSPDLLIVDYTQVIDFEIRDFLSIVENHPLTRILVISSDNNKNTILRILDSGVSGFLTKESSNEEIIQSVNTILKNEKFYCQKVLDLLLQRHKNIDDIPAPASLLSKRELQILQLIVEGNSTILIAEKLYVSHHTINSHRKSILKKLNIKSPTQLIIYAIDAGIIQLK